MFDKLIKGKSPEKFLQFAILANVEGKEIQLSILT